MCQGARRPRGRAVATPRVHTREGVIAIGGGCAVRVRASADVCPCRVAVQKCSLPTSRRPPSSGCGAWSTSTTSSAPCTSASGSKRIPARERARTAAFLDQWNMFGGRPQLITSTTSRSKYFCYKLKKPTLAFPQLGQTIRPRALSSPLCTYPVHCSLASPLCHG